MSRTAFIDTGIASAGGLSRNCVTTEAVVGRGRGGLGNMSTSYGSSVQYWGLSLMTCTGAAGSSIIGKCPMVGAGAGATD